MRYKIFFLVWLGLMLIVWAGHGQGRGPDRLMFLDEIRPGMEGYGKTVIRGTEIRAFPIKVVGVIDNPGDLDDHIVIRAGGDVIREAGGIAAGMSGSPIYVNDRLIGALWGAATFDISNTPIALVRPIGTMLALAESIRAKAQRYAGHLPARSALGQIVLDGQKKQIELAPNASSPIVHHRQPDTIFVRPVMTPVMVSGLSGRALDFLKNGLSERLLGAHSASLLNIRQDEFFRELEQGLEERFDIKLIQAPVPARATVAAYSAAAAPFEEGGALAAMLTYGDISLGAIGTVSYTDGDLLLAFGHPFLFNGDVEFFLTEAVIIDTVESLQIPFKLGVPTRARGTVLEDRMQGIGGMVALEPRHVEVEIAVKNKDSGLNRKVSYQIGYQENLVPFLLFASGLQVMDEALNRIGAGTMKITYTIQGRGMPKTLTRDDVYASFTDIAVGGPLRAAQILFLLTRNEFVDPELTKITMDIELSRPVRAMRIKSLQTDKEKYQPGEAVHYTVVVQPYRGKEQIIEGTLELPKELSDRNSLTLRAYAGPKRGQQRSGDESPEYESLGELVEAVEDVTSNSWLTVEFVDLVDEEEKPKAAVKKSDQKKKETVGGKLTSRHRQEGWFIYGEKTFEIELEETKTKEEEPSPKPTQPEKKPEEQPSKKCKFLFYC
jgi:hypothetical protein